MRVGGILVSFCATLFVQQSAGPLSFEVASIRPSLDPPGFAVGIFEVKANHSVSLRAPFAVSSTGVLAHQVRRR